MYDDWPPQFEYTPTRRERIKDGLFMAFAVVVSLIIIGLQLSPAFPLITMFYRYLTKS